MFLPCCRSRCRALSRPFSCCAPGAARISTTYAWTETKACASTITSAVDAGNVMLRGATSGSLMGWVLRRESASKPLGELLSYLGTSLDVGA